MAGITPDQPIRPDPVAREPAIDVGRVYVGFVNAYFLGAPNGPWVLVDTGLPHAAALVRQRATDRYGTRPPEAIILTHGHFDHAGNALELANEWDVSIYAHPLELPYLNGRSDYPPQDHTVGGALGLMSRAFPQGGMNLGERLRELPEDQSVPGASEWRWLHTPGHTHGHVSLVRDRDRYVVAGDALATVDQDSPLAVFNLQTEFSVPPAPLTTDWCATRASVQALAALDPLYVGAGHGRPVHGAHVAADLRDFVRDFRPPGRGRYVERPVIADDSGVVSVPPPVADPLPSQLLSAGAITAAACPIFRGGRKDSPT